MDSYFRLTENICSFFNFPLLVLYDRSLWEQLIMWILGGEFFFWSKAVDPRRKPRVYCLAPEKNPPLISTTTLYSIWLHRVVIEDKMGEEDYDLEGGGDGEMAFNDKSVRRGFIKKVYAIISVQVSTTKKKSHQNCTIVPSSYSPSAVLLLSTRAMRSSKFG